MTVYYNEIDPFAAETLRNLIKAGLIAPGVVDERSIEDVNPQDLREFKQCHFFAGVGVWSYALRRAGWPDDRAVWTGSCPCQPFSTAGKGAGFADERHLWPHFFHLIRERRPAVIYGEQVASRDADPWIDLVCDDLEALDYAVGAVPFPSAGVGAPHIRDRLYWVAHADGARLEGRGEMRQRAGECAARTSSVVSGLGNAQSAGGREQFRDVFSTAGPLQRTTPRQRDGDASRPSSSVSGLAHSDVPLANGRASGRKQQVHDGHGRSAESLFAAGPTNGFWGAADWLFCRDGRWRPVEPGTFPLADGVASRMDKLRAYGNAINAEAARVFIEASMS